MPLLLSKHRAPCAGGEFHLDVQFLARAEASLPGLCSPESDEVRWFRVDDLPQTDDSVYALVSAAVVRNTARAVSSDR